MKLRSVILSTIVVVLIMAGIITGLSVTKQLDNERVCTQLQIIVTDSAERQFVDKAELIRLLRTGGQYPVGKRLNTLSMDSIENIITAHPMVRKAECYPTAQNHIHVVLHQRVPLLKVVTESGNYFIDTDRLPMPVRESVRTNVLIVSGHVGERANSAATSVSCANCARSWREASTPCPTNRRTKNWTSDSKIK